MVLPTWMTYPVGYPVTYYRKDGKTEIAEVTAVHTDAEGEPYYTIRLIEQCDNKNKEIQTVRSRLSSSIDNLSTQKIQAKFDEWRRQA